MRFRILLTDAPRAGGDPALGPGRPGAKPVNVGGVWEMTMQTPQGDMTADATFVQENDKFKFTMPGRRAWRWRARARSRARTRVGRAPQRPHGRHDADL